MRILVVSQFYHPDEFRINDITRQMAADGHTVHVLTGLPDYTTGRVPKDYRFFRRRRETVDGVHIHRVPIIARRHGVFFRVLNYLSFVLFGCLWAWFCGVKADVVFSYETSPVLQVMPAIAFAKRRRLPLVIYCCDIWPECLKVWGVKEQHPLFRYMKRKSRDIFNAGDRVAISSLPFREYLQTVNEVPDAKIVELLQHAEDLFADIAGEYQENGVVDFLFAGNIGAAQNVDCIVRAADVLRRQNAKPFHIHIVGDGSERAACEQLANQLQVADRVTFHGKHPLQEMKRFYRLADCFLLTISAGSVGMATLPAKWQGYISAGKPVVSAAGGACAVMTERAECGLCVPPNDDVALAKAMCQVMEDPASYRVCGLNGRRFYEQNCTRELYMRRLYALFDEVVREKAALTNGSRKRNG